MVRSVHPIRLLSAAGQVAAHLRGELERGHWSGNLPGVGWLATELGVNRKTVEAALRQLEREGLLAGQGPGRRRRIVPPDGNSARPVRVAILLYEPADRFLAYIVELQHALVEAGHTAILAGKAMSELGTDVTRIGRLVKQTEADAWVVLAGAREVLEWFSVQPSPAFALFGRREGIPIAAAGPDKPPAFADAMRRLLALGHRRIVSICRSDRRKPVPGGTERVLLEELNAQGIATSDYNLPDWDETPEGFQQLLISLFRVTPPTALIVQEATFFAATQQFLARRRLRVPEQVSLVCMDPDPDFLWCIPSIAHIAWDPDPVVRRIVRWAATVGRGGKDVRQTLTAAEFIPGGTIGPAPVNRF
jgi:DNA-binding LacI/PurR family transcriptional regulator